MAQLAFMEMLLAEGVGWSGCIRCPACKYRGTITLLNEETIRLVTGKGYVVTIQTSQVLAYERYS